MRQLKVHLQSVAAKGRKKAKYAKKEAVRGPLGVDMKYNPDTGEWEPQDAPFTSLTAPWAPVEPDDAVEEDSVEERVMNVEENVAPAHPMVQDRREEGRLTQRERAQCAALSLIDRITMSTRGSRPAAAAFIRILADESIRHRREGWGSIRRGTVRSVREYLAKVLLGIRSVQQVVDLEIDMRDYLNIEARWILRRMHQKALVACGELETGTGRTSIFCRTIANGHPVAYAKDSVLPE